jgi:hypothetical protein
VKCNLAVGYGEVESAHRYVFQKRLKLAGVWWNIEHEKNMINLRAAFLMIIWDHYRKKSA